MILAVVFIAIPLRGIGCLRQPFQEQMGDPCLECKTIRWFCYETYHDYNAFSAGDG